MDDKLKQAIIKIYDEDCFIYDETKDIYANYASQLYNIPYEKFLKNKREKKLKEIIEEYLTRKALLNIQIEKINKKHSFSKVEASDEVEI